MKKIRKKTFKRGIHILDLGDWNGLGWVRKPEKSNQKRNIVFKFFRLVFMQPIR